MMGADLFAWLAVNDPGGSNPNTGASWRDIARRFFKDSVNHGPQPYGVVGFLTNAYPTTETKALGWMQLFLFKPAAPPEQNRLRSIEPGRGYWIYLRNPSSLTTSAMPPQPVSLLDGWNLVGYIGSETRSVTEALAGLTGAWSIIWTWDNGLWQAAIPDDSFTLPVEPLTQLRPGKAYWIKINPGSGPLSWTP